MKLARGLERRLERMVEGLAAKLFRGNLQPVEVANRVVREADLAMVDSAAGPTVPNVYRVTLSPGDVADAGTGMLCLELEAVVTETAIDRGWRLEGPVEVTVARSDEVAGGTLAVTVDFAPGPLPPWANLLSRHGVFPIAHNRSIVGRSRTADVRIGDDQVSRNHALIWRESGHAWVADLGSANGTTHQGRLLGSAAAIEDGDQVAFGPATFTFRIG